MSEEQKTEEQLYAMPLDELAKLIVTEEPQSQPRDEHGRFKAADPAPEPELEAAPAPVIETPLPAPVPVIYKRVIDLGDGSGTQVFQADSADGLLDQLAEAQKNATKKIREQAEQLKQAEAQRQAEESDNDYVYSQELMSKPTAAFKKIFKATTGYDIDTFKSTLERVEAFEAAQTQKDAQAAQEAAQAEASEAFIKDHPEYIGNKRNGQLLVDRIELLGIRAQKAGKNTDYATLLQKAYQDLKTDGLLELKGEEADVDTETKITAPQRIAEPVSEVPPQRTPTRASSISTRIAPRAPVVQKNEPSEEELYSMPLDKLRELAVKQAT